MEALYLGEEGTVAEIKERISDSPSMNAMRTLVQILEEKGYLTRTKKGREFVYRPKEPRKQAGREALDKVIDIFFKGSLEDALAAHFGDKTKSVDDDTLRQIKSLIEDAKKREESE